MKLQTIKDAVKRFKEDGFGGWSDERVDAFWGSLTGNTEHKITQCMDKMDGKVDDPGAFCGALAKRAGYKPGEKEAMTSGANGQLQRPTGRKKECRESMVRLLEIKQTDDGKFYVPCIIIRQGLGNFKDRNYYSRDAIVSGAPVYEGKPAYFDHPTPTEESEQPGRSVRDLMGHYEDCQAVSGPDGLMELRAKFVPEYGNDIMGKIQHAVEYQKKYPDKDYLGISINGDGEGETMPYEDFVKKVNPSAKEMEKIKQVEGQDINVITKLTDAFSADFVTAAGAGGRVLKENQKPIRRRLMGLSKYMKQFFMGIEENDETKIQGAVKGLRTVESEDEDEKKKEDEGKGMGHKIHGYMKQMRKEMKKGEDEGDESYEKRVIMAAIKKHEDEMKKESEKHKEDEDEDEKKKKEAEKKKGEHGDGADDGDADDKKDDKKKESDIRKELSALKESVAELRKENALLKVKKEIKDRAAKVDQLLAESGLPMRVTKHARAVVEACKTEDDMKKTIKEFQEAYTETQEASFARESGDGFGEKTSGEGSDGKNDDCF